MDTGLYGLPLGRRKRYAFTKFQGARVARLNSAQTIPNGSAYISWDTVVWMTGGPVADVVVSPLRLTAPVEGWWECGFGCDLASVSGGTSRGFVQIDKFDANGVAQRTIGRQDYQGILSLEGECSNVAYFEPGEYVQCLAFQATGGGRNVQTTNLTNGLHNLTAYMARVG